MNRVGFHREIPQKLNHTQSFSSRTSGVRPIRSASAVFGFLEHHLIVLSARHHGKVGLSAGPNHCRSTTAPPIASIFAIHSATEAT
jgi:hypothetical protein